MKKLMRFLWPFLILMVLLMAAYMFFFHFRPDITAGLLSRLGDSMSDSGRYSAAIRYYSWASDLSPQNTALSLKLSEAYGQTGNYTQTESVLVHAIYNEPENVDLYVALSKVYVDQDKLLDAQRMLDTIANPKVSEALSARRPAAPEISPAGDRYSDYITVELSVPSGIDCYYTTDGQYPSLQSNAYNGPFTLPAGETTVCAVAVDQDGLVSPAVFEGYTIAGVIEDVTFHDEALRAAVEETLQTSGTGLQTNDLWTITEFKLPEGVSDTQDMRLFAGLTKLTVWDAGELDYAFLPELRALRYLELNNCSVSAEAMEYIAACPGLEVLVLSSCGLSNVDALSQLHNLRILDLSDNSIGDISVISEMNTLDELYLGHNGLTHLPSMLKLTNLRILDLSYNALDSITRVGECKAMERLNVSHNRLVSIKAAEGLTGLVFFNGSNNDVRDVRALAGCMELRTFLMTDNKLVSIDFLEGHSAIQEINIDYNDVRTVPDLPDDCELELFSAAHNYLEDLSGLAGLTKLNFVNADYNNISNISVLKDCPVLAQVNVYGTNIHSGGVLEDNGVVVNYTPSFN